MSSVNLPGSVYPNGQDTDATLMRVHNVSECPLSEPFLVTQDKLHILPDFTQPERFAPSGGFIHVDGEDLYYSKTETAYPDSDIVHSTGGFFVSQLDVAYIGESIMIDGLVPDSSSGFNSVTLKNISYTLVGIIEVGQSSVEISVRGNGPHGNGSEFTVSRPDLVQTQFCSIDADIGRIVISTINFGWTMGRIWWKAPITEDDGSPIRRVSSMSGLIRGMRGTSPRDHDAGEIARSYIMSEHHEVIAKALIATEDFVGIDFSDIRYTLDFRLRDLVDVCIEDDDHGCPDAAISFTEVKPDSVDESCLRSREFDFVVNIDGDYNRFGIFFGDGTRNTTDLEVRHKYAATSRIEPTIYVANDTCEVTSSFFEAKSLKMDIPDLPNLVCPSVYIPELNIPEINIPEFNPGDTIVNITGPSWSFPSIWLSIPTFISVNMPEVSFPEVSFSMPSFPDISVTFDVPDLSIFYSVSIDAPPESGPCFQLVPCNSGYHHPGYH